MFECLGEKESGKVRGGALMECVASTGTFSRCKA
jgi:hypothetical protein